MKTFTFEIDTIGRKVYQVESETAEEATKLLIDADNNEDDKYLIESEGEQWNINIFPTHINYDEKVQDCITDERECE